MSSPTPPARTSSPHGSHASDSNLGVDYVIQHEIPSNDRDGAEASYVSLVEALTKVGLATEVRPGDDTSLLVLVKVASDELLSSQIYRARLQDWLCGVRTSAPDSLLGPGAATGGKDNDNDPGDLATPATPATPTTSASLPSNLFQSDPVTEAERLRLVYLLITGPPGDGGAGITPGQGKWKHVRAIFPPHDPAFNREWLRTWSHKYLLDQADLDEIRDKFGERVAFYFAFTQSYFWFLMLPACFGFAAWMVLGRFSFVYALVSCLWSVVFFEYWKTKEVDLAVQWGVRGVSKIQHPRPQFRFDFETEDPVTGERVKVYSPLKRLRYQLLQIPFAAVCVLVLGCLIGTVNSLEIFIGQVYDGPLKQYLGFLPTVLLVVLTPTVSGGLTIVAEKLADWENYDTIDAHHAALVQKQFVLNFMTSYMPLLFTAFMYIPFPHVIEPLLRFWHSSFQAVSLATKSEPPASRSFQSNPSRISAQMFFYAVTANVVSLATETIVPKVKRAIFKKVKDVHAKTAGGSSPKRTQPKDHEDEAEFLQRVRAEMELPEYDVTEDYREMVMQFGYMSLFSVSWPLTPVCFLVNNWIELRSDALKMATTSRRPIPWRSDSIGPWLTALGFLSWLGSLSSSAIVYLCRGADGSSPADVRGWSLLLAVLLSEHFYLAVQIAVAHVLGRVESPGLQKERRERYSMKRRLMRENLGVDPGRRGQGTPERQTIEKTERITREALEDEARKSSVKGGGSPTKMFWLRQRGMGETIQIGRGLMEQLASKSSSKASK